MYVYKRQVVTYQGIATLLTLALVLWGVGTHMFTQTVEAANLTSVSDLLTNSAPGESSVHTITFTTPNGMVTGGEFTLDFPAGFVLSSLVIGDISLSVGGSGATIGASAGAGQWGVVVGGNNSVTFETPTDGGVASSTELIITLGDEGGTMITNPNATTSYQIAIGNTSFSASSTIADGGYARVAIVDDVLVTAQILTTMTFTVAGLAQGATVNGSATTTFDDSTSVALPFGTLNAGISKTLGQRLNVATNAANGYVVTVEQDTELISSTGAVIDGFIDGSWTQAPSAWQAPGNSVGDPTSWGHWGLTSDDTDTIARTAAGDTEFGADQWVSGSTTPIVIMGHDAPSDGVTNGVGSTTVGYQIQTTALQEAGDDYSTTLTYIATPTF